MLKPKIFIFVTLIALAGILLTPGAAFADEANGNMEMDINGYHIRLTFSPPSRVGRNEFHVYLLDLDNTPLKSAVINLMAAPFEPTGEPAASLEKNPMLAGHFILHQEQELPTPASAGGANDWEDRPTLDPSVENQIEHPSDHILVALRPGQNAGEYLGVVSFPQAGHWMLLVDFMARGKVLTAGFPLTVTGQPAVPNEIILGGLGISAALIGAVIINRRKQKPGRIA